jgi:hypothetical protein
VRFASEVCCGSAERAEGVGRVVDARRGENGDDGEREERQEERATQLFSSKAALSLSLDVSDDDEKRESSRKSVRHCSDLSTS